MQGSGVANTEMGKTGRGVDLGRKILSSVLNILSLRKMFSNQPLR